MRGVIAIVIVTLPTTLFALLLADQRQQRQASQMEDGSFAVMMRNGAVMPAIGLGTGAYGGRESGDLPHYWDDNVTEQAVRQWLELGGRRIDTALNYANERAVGRAVAGSGVPRSNLFISSKVAGAQPMGFNETLDAAKRVLDELNTSYVDLLLLHTPGTYPSAVTTDPACCAGGQCDASAPNTIDSPACRKSTWKAMQRLLKTGVTRAIGVSNFQVHHLNDIFAVGQPFPDIHQDEHHPYYHDDELIDFGIKHHMLFNAYASLGSRDFTGSPDFTRQHPNWAEPLLENPSVLKIAKENNMTAASVLLRWAWQGRAKAVVNPRSRDPEHMRENLKAATSGRDLSRAQMQALNYLQRRDKIGPITKQVS